MIARTPLVISSMIIGSFFIHMDSCFGMSMEEVIRNRLERKKSVRQSLQLFEAMNPSSPSKKSVKDKQSLDSKELDEWPSSEEEGEDTRHFSLPTRSRALHMRKEIENGHNPEDLQRASNDWYTRNRMLCIDADQLLKDGLNQKAHLLIVQASDDGYPGATFELAKQALDDKQLHKARLYLRKTCEQLRDKGHLLDNQYRDEQLVKGIKAFAKRDIDLEEVLKDFQDVPCFQTQQDSAEKPKASALNPSLLRYAEEADEEDFGLFEQVAAIILNQRNEAPEVEDELFFDEE